MRARLCRRIKPLLVSSGPPPVGPSISSLSPSSASQYDDPINPMTINGSGFNLGDVAYWNGTPLATTYVNSSTLTAVVPKTLLYTSGSKSVQVNGTSNTVTFTVSAWTVASMTGVTAWWRVDDIVEAPAGFVQTMNAKVGTFTMTQAAAANRPELITSDANFNNKPTIRRNTGLNQSLTSAATFQQVCTATDGTLLAVGALDAISGLTRIFFSVSSGGTIGIYSNNSGNAVVTRNYDGTADSASVAYTLGTAARFEWRHTGGTLYARVNNTESSVASSTTTAGLTTTMGIFISLTTTDVNRLAEAICLNVAISSTDRIRYNNYVEDRYGIAA